ncbi:hypothetical protein Dda_7893 [Drechslerella dactyloides]|uniref:Cut9 interacting protein Scn1 n=1 Tax=Drechslerella dactyloides TaxID=74499 RepID=A0AAD6ISV0_DREDA|nr:hypothetical protein Dda_7893 [Drechslerella dactyloides]
MANEPPADDALTTLDDALWQLGVHDAHCHPTDTMDVVPEIPSRRIRTLTIMATRANDQQLVAQVARVYGVDVTGRDDKVTCRVVPSFGWHPWYSHLLLDDMNANTNGGATTLSKTEHYTAVLLGDPTDEFIATLPDPKPLSEFIAETRARLLEFPSALVGEVGIDRTFRLPHPPSAAPSPDGKRLTPYKVSLDHQRRVLEEQLRLAGALHRPASIHGVGAHGVLHDALAALFRGYERPIRSNRTRKRGPHDFEGDDPSDDEEETQKKGDPPFPPRICLHSFSAPPDFLKTWLSARIPAAVYFSFSRAINVGYGYDKFAEMLKMVPEDKLLVESDLHVASVEMERDLAVIVRKVASERGWELERTVTTLGRNWRRFVYGEDEGVDSSRQS